MWDGTSDLSFEATSVYQFLNYNYYEWRQNVQSGSKINRVFDSYGSAHWVKISADSILKYFWYFSPQKKTLQFHANFASLGDNLQAVSTSIFWGCHLLKFLPRVLSVQSTFQNCCKQHIMFSEKIRLHISLELSTIFKWNVKLYFFRKKKPQKMWNDNTRPVSCRRQTTLSKTAEIV